MRSTLWKTRFKHYLLYTVFRNKFQKFNNINYPVGGNHVYFYPITGHSLRCAKVTQSYADMQVTSPIWAAGGNHVYFYPITGHSIRCAKVTHSYVDSRWPVLCGQQMTSPMWTAGDQSCVDRRWPVLCGQWVTSPIWAAGDQSWVGRRWSSEPGMAITWSR